MAELTIAVESLVRWPLKGGFAFGKISKLSEDNKTAFVETPSGSIAEASCDSLIACSEDEYNEQLEALASTISKKVKKGAKMADKDNTATACDGQAKELAAMKEKVEAMDKELAAVKSEAAEAKAKLTATEAALTEAKAKAQDAEAKFQKVEKDALAKDRYAQLEKVEASANIAKSETEALAILGDMNEAAFNTLLAVAVSGFKKLTDQSASGKPKTTDQSVSSEPKSTEASASAAEVLDGATKDKDADLAAAGAAASENVLTGFVAKAFPSRKKVKVEKK
jgi:septal ring factor EnvC (AmiA/AmiB activator)